MAGSYGHFAFKLLIFSAVEVNWPSLVILSVERSSPHSKVEGRTPFLFLTSRTNLWSAFESSGIVLRRHKLENSPVKHPGKKE